MPSLSPRPHAADRDLAAKPTQASNADQGYLMMEKTALRSGSNCAAQAWPNPTGAALPNGSRRRKSEAQISLPRHHHRSPGAPRSPTASHVLITFGHIGFWSEIQPTINTHRPRPKQLLSPTHF